ncbi:hypothetical protein [Agromyces humi]|uniref:hypothetical protein n=1 Tax=Agromyces humi TaxID=1766800 RepID=UPI001359B9F9|nr:hypothetical protein [Agromyces humi]
MTATATAEEFWQQLIPEGRDYEMVRRDQLQPGDVAVSSHYGVRTVKRITLAGMNGETTQIDWEGGAWIHPMLERNDSHLLIPRLSRNLTPAIRTFADDTSAGIWIGGTCFRVEVQDGEVTFYVGDDVEEESVWSQHVGAVR